MTVLNEGLRTPNTADVGVHKPNSTMFRGQPTIECQTDTKKKSTVVRRKRDAPVKNGPVRIKKMQKTDDKKPVPVKVVKNQIPKFLTVKKESKQKLEKGQQVRSRLKSSSYRGVSRCAKDGRWQARIRIGKTVKYLGRFKTEEAAAQCYDMAAKEYHGLRAVLNFGTNGVDNNPKRKNTLNTVSPKSGGEKLKKRQKDSNDVDVNKFDQKIPKLQIRVGNQLKRTERHQNLQSLLQSSQQPQAPSPISIMTPPGIYPGPYANCSTEELKGMINQFNMFKQMPHFSAGTGNTSPQTSAYMQGLQPLQQTQQNPYGLIMGNLSPCSNLNFGGLSPLAFGNMSPSTPSSSHDIVAADGLMSLNFK